MLHALGYSLQGNRKNREGGRHPDRNAQFEYIAARVEDFRARGQPAISVDTKKKELVGDFKNAGREWRPKGQPEEVRTHDFIDEVLGKAIPYGVYDLAANHPGGTREASRHLVPSSSMLTSHSQLPAIPNTVTAPAR